MKSFEDLEDDSTETTLEDQFSMLTDAYHHFFTAFNNRETNKPFSDLEIDGVIHRFDNLLVFTLEMLRNYLGIKDNDDTEIEEEELIALAYEKKIISDTGPWLLALEVSSICFFSNDKEFSTEIMIFINEVFQDNVRELYDYFADKF